MMFLNCDNFQSLYENYLKQNLFIAEIRASGIAIWTEVPLKERNWSS